MAGAIRPVAKGVYVCDDVIGDPASGKPMLVNLWDTYFVRPDAVFPVRVQKLCVFAWLRGGRGTVGVRVDIVQARTGQLIGRTRTLEVDFSEPNRSMYTRMMIPNFPFPEAGVYVVEVYCDSVFLDDQPVQIQVRPEVA